MAEAGIDKIKIENQDSQDNQDNQNNQDKVETDSSETGSQSKNQEIAKHTKIEDQNDQDSSNHQDKKTATNIVTKRGDTETMVEIRKEMSVHDTSDLDRDKKNVKSEIGRDLEIERDNEREIQASRSYTFDMKREIDLTIGSTIVVNLNQTITRETIEMREGNTRKTENNTKMTIDLRRNISNQLRIIEAKTMGNVIDGIGKKIGKKIGKRTGKKTEKKIGRRIVKRTEKKTDKKIVTKIDSKICVNHHLAKTSEAMATRNNPPKDMTLTEPTTQNQKND